MNMADSFHRVLGGLGGRCRWLPGALAGGLVLAVAAPAQAQSAAVATAGAAATPTFAKDVAPILQQNCQTCHRPGSIAPMSLLTYEETRPWARMIADRVEKRIMPPWPIDMNVGVRDFKNDMSLSDAEIQTIVRWVAAGAPAGDMADMPPPVEWPEYSDEWQYEEVFNRPPDLVVASPAYKVLSNGLDQWPDPVSKVTGLAGPRWIRAVEVRPGTPETRYVFHHANPSLVQDGVNTGLVQTAVGTQGFIFPEDAGKLIKPGAEIEWGMHLYPVGEDVDAVLEVGLWFYPEGEEPEFETPGEVLFEIAQNTGAGGDFPFESKDPQIVRRGDLIIPPHSMATYRGVYVLDRPARVHSLRGHMHLRGKFQIVEAIYPDGRWEIVNKLNWDHAWHTAFLYEDHAMPMFPKGTVLIFTSVFDNTTANRYNPDPEQWVVAGDRTVDEMSHLRLGITYFDDEEDFQRLLRRRDELRKLRESQTTQAAPAQSGKDATSR